MKKVIRIVMFLCVCLIGLSTMTSCDKLRELNRFGAELIPGPWKSNGHLIEEIGFGEYKVTDLKTQTSTIEYLNAFSSYATSVPDSFWPERYEPYWNTLYGGEIAWIVYGRGPKGTLIIQKNGKYYMR